MTRKATYPKIDRDKFSTFLRMCRNEYGLSREVAAKKIGIPHYSLKNYEEGLHIPKTECMMAISKFYKFDLNMLFKF